MKKLTRVRSDEGGGGGKITSGGSLTVSLEIAVDGVAAVSANRVRVETGSALTGRVAIRPGSACVVQGFLQHRVAHSLLANAPRRT